MTIRHNRPFFAISLLTGLALTGCASDPSVDVANGVVDDDPISFGYNGSMTACLPQVLTVPPETEQANNYLLVQKCSEPGDAVCLGQWIAPDASDLHIWSGNTAGDLKDHWYEIQSTAEATEPGFYLKPGLYRMTAWAADRSESPIKFYTPYDCEGPDESSCDFMNGLKEATTADPYGNEVPAFAIIEEAGREVLVHVPTIQEGADTTWASFDRNFCGN